PAALGTDIQELFTVFLIGPSDFPTRFREDLTAVYQIFGLWIAAAAVFAAAPVLLAIVRRTAASDHWARGLPAYACSVAPWTCRSSPPTDRGIECGVGPFLALALDFQECPVLIENLPVELLLSGQPEDARKVRLEVRA